MKHFKKPCHAGAAYLCQGYVGKFPDETKAYFCFKCGREIEYKNYRWIHKLHISSDCGEIQGLDVKKVKNILTGKWGEETKH